LPKRTTTLQSFKENFQNQKTTVETSTRLNPKPIGKHKHFQKSYTLSLPPILTTSPVFILNTSRKDLENFSESGSDEYASGQFSGDESESIYSSHSEDTMPETIELYINHTMVTVTMPPRLSKSKKISIFKVYWLRYSCNTLKITN
jgi:hypothetical protein